MLTPVSMVVRGLVGLTYLILHPLKFTMKMKVQRLNYNLSVFEMM